jgi:anthranilate synthase component 2
VYHGVTDTIKQTGTDSLFFNLPKQIKVGRYHSWVINKDDFPEALEITSLSENGDIMSIRHKQFNLKGIQFHPESILTPQGKTILSNWLRE